MTLGELIEKLMKLEEGQGALADVWVSLVDDPKATVIMYGELHEVEGSYGEVVIKGIRK